MNVTITPGPLKGSVTPPPSKSQAHRLIIAAALSDGVCRLQNVALSQDIEATLRCMRALDADASADGSVIRGAALVDGHAPSAPQVMDCGESGSTLRFLIPIALALKGEGRFTGRGRLMDRPQEPYFALFREKGIAYALEGGVLTVRGRLAPGIYRLRGDVSSQFVTGLLYALPLLEGDSVIELTSDLESRGYVDMTLDALRRFGVEARRDGARAFRVPGGQVYRHRDAAVEADWSQAAFWYAAAGTGSAVTVNGMNGCSIQGDRAILGWGELLGGGGLSGGATAPVYGRTAPAPAGAARPGRSVRLDVSQCPDLVPPLAAWGALLADTDLYLENAGRLRIKESDRLSAVARVLGAMGARVEEGPDRLTIRGQACLPGGVTVDSHNDHRIAMMAAIAATRCAAPVTITGAECVAKSYPGFWEDYEKLGGSLS